jgi:hypothetical protein
LKIKNLYLKEETNVVRPHRYQHASNCTNYTNYNQRLTDPMELILPDLLASFVTSLYPNLCCNKKRFIQYSETIAQQKIITVAIKSYNSIALANTYNNKIAQGIRTNILFISLQATYQLRHNLFVDLTYIYRKKTSRQSINKLCFLRNKT